MKEDIKKIIENSGNSFHAKVIGKFRDNDWSVLSSPFYSDGISEKSREIDIVAENFYEISKLSQRLYRGYLRARLFIECKYIPKPIVFWFDDKNEEECIAKIMSDTSLKNPAENILIEGIDKYKSKKVAKLFDSGSSRDQENEPIFKAISQCLNSLLYFRNTGLTINKSKNEQATFTIDYPLIILNSFENVYDSEGRQLTEPFKLEVNYAYKTLKNEFRREYFLIDVISFDALNNFFENLAEDARIVATRITEPRYDDDDDDFFIG